MQTESCNNSVVYEPTAGTYKIRFDDDVVHPSYYRFEIEALQRATQHDDVIITINTDGGSLATGIEFTNEILKCNAPVHGVLRSNSHSCGSIIFLACDSHEVGIASEMLLHSGSGGAGGTPAQSVKRAESYKRQVRALFDTVYRGFLTEDELELMIEHDKEYIFSSAEIEERLQKMYQHRKHEQTKRITDQYEAQCDEEDALLEKAYSILETKGLITKEERKRLEDIESALGDLFESGEVYQEPQDKPEVEETLDEEDDTIPKSTYTSVTTDDGIEIVFSWSDTGRLYLDEVVVSEHTDDDLRLYCSNLGIKFQWNTGRDKLIQKLVVYFSDL